MEKCKLINWSNGVWHHGWVTAWNSPNHENVSAVPGSIAIGNGNQIFYRGIENKMHIYYWTPSGWEHAWVGSSAPNWQNVVGDIAVGKYGGNNQVCYRGFDGKMHIYWYNHNNNQWVHDWLENSWQAPTLNNISGSIEAGNGAIFYRANHDGLVRIYYWDGSQLITNNKDEFYAMDQVITKPKIPLGSSELKMLVYPNPVENNLYINLVCPQEDTYLFTLTSISGNVVIVASKSLFQGSNSFELALSDRLKPGVYILSAQNQRTFEKAQEKIIKL